MNDISHLVRCRVPRSILNKAYKRQLTAYEQVNALLFTEKRQTELLLLAMVVNHAIYEWCNFARHNKVTSCQDLLYSRIWECRISLHM